MTPPLNLDDDEAREDWQAGYEDWLTERDAFLHDEPAGEEALPPLADTTSNCERLRDMGACIEALEWLANCDSWATAWNTCQRGDWMLWLAARKNIDRRRPVLAACECARIALPYAKDPSALVAIETTERWARGEATVDEVRAAANAANAAANAADLIDWLDELLLAARKILADEGQTDPTFEAELVEWVEEWIGESA